MMGLAALSFEIDGDVSGFNKAAAEAGKGLKKMEENLEDLRNAAGIATGALAAFLGAAIKEFSELEQTQARVRTAFGENADAVNAWAKTLGDAVGRSDDTLSGLAATARLAAGSLFANDEQATQAAQAFAQLAVQMEKVTGVESAQALDALSAALSGSTRGLKQFGIIITESDLKTEMFRQSIQGKVSDLTDAQKAVLTYNLILEKSATIQAGAANATGTLREAMTQLKESTGDVFESLGQTLAPAVLEVVNSLKQAVEWFNRLPESTKETIAKALAVSAAVAGITAAVSALLLIAPQIGAAFVGLGALGVTLTGLVIPIAAIAGALLSVVALIGVFRRVWKGTASDFEKSIVSAMLTPLQNLLGLILTVVSTAKKLRDAIPPSMFGVGTPRTAPSAAPSMFGAGMPTTAPGAGGVGDIANEVLAVLKEGALGAGKDLLDLAKTTDIVKSIMAAFTPVVAQTKEATEGLGEKMRAADGATTDAKKSVMKFDAVTIEATRSLDKIAEWQLPDFANIPSPPPLVQVDQDWLDFQNNMNQFSSGLAAGAQQLVAAIPRLNDLVGAAAQGAQMGGVWGALIAVFVQLISQTEAFDRILKIVDDDLNQLIGGLEPLVNGIAALMDAFDPISNVITELITTALAPIGSVLKVLVPILGVIFKALAPVLQLLMIPMKLVAALFEGLASAFDKAAPAIKEVTDKLDQFARWVDQLIHGIENWALSITNAIPTQFKAVGTGTVVVKNTDAIDDNTKSQIQMTDAARAATEALTNIPQGYKVAVARFAALAAETGGGLMSPIVTGLASIPQMQHGGIVTSPTLAMIGEGGPEAVVPLGGGGGGMGTTINIEHITIVAPNPAAFWKELRREVQRESFLRTGASIASAPQWVGG
jgi:hypothetical protein